MSSFSTLNILTLPPGRASVEFLPENGWLLTLPAGPADSYRVAQLDDYRHLPRNRFRWLPPVTLSLTAQVSSPSVPGTWGFGFWNDPFSFSLGARGSSRRLPALPNAAWFFYASPENHLSLRDDLPANSLLAGVFRSPLIPSAGLVPALFALPLLAIPATARWLRRLARFVIQQDAARLDVEETQPHEYRLEWQTHAVRFDVDGQPVFETPLTPRGRLGLVIWIDNQYAAFTADGKIRFGTLPDDAASLRITEIQLVG
jgi:hypothetical protein